MKAPKNGYAMGIGTQYGEEVRFRCEEGYFLQGEALISCQASGEWSALTPTCRRECATIVITMSFNITIFSLCDWM